MRVEKNDVNEFVNQPELQIKLALVDNDLGGVMIGQRKHRRPLRRNLVFTGPANKDSIVDGQQCTPIASTFPEMRKCLGVTAWVRRDRYT